MNDSSFFNDSGLDPDDFDYKQDYVYTRETQKEILLGGQTLRYLKSYINILRNIISNTLTLKENVSLLSFEHVV